MKAEHFQRRANCICSSQGEARARGGQSELACCETVLLLLLIVRMLLLLLAFSRQCADAGQKCARLGAVGAPARVSRRLLLVLERRRRHAGARLHDHTYSCSFASSQLGPSDRAQAEAVTVAWCPVQCPAGSINAQLQ